MEEISSDDSKQFLSCTKIVGGPDLNLAVV